MSKVDTERLQRLQMAEGTLLVSGARAKRCGTCAGCLRGDCGECMNCKDKLKFGGPALKRQACVNRTCDNAVPAAVAPGADAAPRPACSPAEAAHAQQLELMAELLRANPRAPPWLQRLDAGGGATAQVQTTAPVAGGPGASTEPAPTGHEARRLGTSLCATGTPPGGRVRRPSAAARQAEEDSDEEEAPPRSKRAAGTVRREDLPEGPCRHNPDCVNCNRHRGLCKVRPGMPRWPVGADRTWQRPAAAFDRRKPFVAASAFDGARVGSVFRAGPRGTGYYRDVGSPAAAADEMAGPLTAKHLQGVDGKSGGGSGSRKAIRGAGGKDADGAPRVEVAIDKGILYSLATEAAAEVQGDLNWAIYI